MNIYKSLHNFLFLLLTASVLFLSACQPAISAASHQPPAQATSTPVRLVTKTLAQPTPESNKTPGGISLDYAVVAQNMTFEVVAAVPPSGDDPWYASAPQYRLITLQGYPVSAHVRKPQIYVYPAGDLASANENMGKMAADLQTLLQTRQAADQLPFLPLVSDRQTLDAHVKYLDFKGGKRVRFLTQLNNGLTPINNYQVIYSFQGLTSDGNFYIAAVLPITNPELPAGSEISDQQAKALNDFPGYLSNTLTMLNQQAAVSFTPDLNKLDELIRSIEVQ